MKKITTFLLALIFCIDAAIGQAPVITMTTAQAIGSTFTFSLAANVTKTQIKVDFGDGTLVTQTIGTSSDSISGTLVGSQTVKIYGTRIVHLDCRFNQLSALDVTQNIALSYLDCSFNQLTALDVSKNIALTKLGCSNNLLTALDVTKNTALKTLDCSDNQITALDVTKNTALTELSSFNNNVITMKKEKELLEKLEYKLGNIYFGDKWPTDPYEVVPNCVNFYRFFDNDIQLCQVKVYSTNGKIYLGTHIVEQVSALLPHGFFNLNHQEINYINQGNKQLMLKIFPGKRDDLRGNVYTHLGVLTTIEINKPIWCVTPDQEHQMLDELRVSGPGAVQIREGDKLVFDSPKAPPEWGHAKKYQIELYDSNHLLEIFYADFNYEDKLLLISGEEARNAAKNHTLKIRIYPGLYKKNPSYEDYSMRYVEFNYSNLKGADWTKIQGLSEADSKKLIAGIRTDQVNYTVIKNDGVKNLYLISLPHSLVGKYEVKIMGYNPYGKRAYTQFVKIKEDQNIAFEMEPDAWPNINIKPNSDITLELFLGIDIDQELASYPNLDYLLRIKQTWRAFTKIPIRLIVHIGPNQEILSITR